MRTETRAQRWARFKWVAWVRRIACDLIRATDSGIVAWQANQRRAWCVRCPDLNGDAYSVSVTRRDNCVFMLRAAYITFRDGKCMQCEAFFIGESGSGLPLDKLWCAIRKSCCRHTKGDK